MKKMDDFLHISDGFSNRREHVIKRLDSDVSPLIADRYSGR